MKLRFFCSLFAAVIAGNLFSAAPAQPNAVVIDTKMQPTIGYPKARVQVVAFLEPKCPDSKKYNNNVFPKFEKEFINTNKVLYTVIPVSFLPHSMPASIALLCVYNQNPDYPNDDLFFKYLDYIYQHQPPEKDDWATVETLQKFAAATSPAIQLDRLKNCIETEHYRVQIAQNTAYGNRLMGRVSTPTIYVNGIKVENTDETIDYDKLKAVLLQELQKPQS